MKRWSCQICNKSFINEFCGELKTFIRDSILCETCKLTNYAIIFTDKIFLKSSDNSSSVSSATNNSPLKKRTRIKKSIEHTNIQIQVPERYNSNEELFHKVIIECSNISNSFNNYYVRTSLEEISRIIKKIEHRPLVEIKRVLASCLREIMQYNETTLRIHCRTNSQEWKYWCSDVVIYFICRKILFNKPVPIYDETP